MAGKRALIKRELAYAKFIYKVSCYTPTIWCYVEVTGTNDQAAVNPSCVANTLYCLLWLSVTHMEVTINENIHLPFITSKKASPISDTIYPHRWQLTIDSWAKKLKNGVWSQTQALPSNRLKTSNGY